MARYLNRTEAVETDAGATASNYFDSLRKSRLTRAALLAGSIASAAAFAFSKPSVAKAHPEATGTYQQAAPNRTQASGPMQYVGVVEPRFMYSSPDEAAALANSIRDNGFNLVRLVEYDAQGENGHIPDWHQFCVAAGAILDAGLNLEVTFRGLNKWVPSTTSEIYDLQATLAAYQSLLAGPNLCPEIYPNSNPHPMIAFQITDEWNMPLFVNDPQKDVVNFVNIHKVIYPTLKKLAGQLGMNFQIWALGMTSAHNPYQEIQAIGQEMKKQGLKANQLFDAIAQHPYMEFSSTPPSQKYGVYRWGISDYDLFSKALEKYMGFYGPTIYDEWGIQTDPSEAPPGLYDGTQPDANKVSEAIQANYYTSALKIIACQKNDAGVPNLGLVNMHFVDNSNAKEAWRGSGFEYPNGSPKKSLPAVRAANIAARAGTLTTCAAQKRTTRKQ